MRLIDLAEAARVSKGYLSEIENGESTRVSGEKLYGIASALGVNMSDLLGVRLIAQVPDQIPRSLREFADELHLPEADVQMLAGIQFRGGQPRSRERWNHIYSAIRSTEWMDERG
jgi:transcriptional regulator with XRE-family HTH domain